MADLKLKYLLQSPQNNCQTEGQQFKIMYVLYR